MPLSPDRSTSSFLIHRNTLADSYSIWRFDPDAEDPFIPVDLDPGASFDRRNSLIWVGGYFLEWGPVQDARTASPYYEYRLYPFDPASTDPLSVPALQSGQWPKKKFWGHGADFANPHGGHEQFEMTDALTLIPLGTFLLNLIPTEDRGTFSLWNFDPCPDAPGQADPIPGNHPYTPAGSFRDIQLGHELLPLDGYALDRTVATGEYRLWSFDPQATIPLVHPPVQQGIWAGIGAAHRLVPLGDHVLEWNPKDRSYRLWRFDPKSGDPLCGPERTGTMPAAFTSDTTLFGFQPNTPVNAERAADPGTIDFMRSKIRHVVAARLVRYPEVTVVPRRADQARTDLRECLHPRVTAHGLPDAHATVRRRVPARHRAATQHRHSRPASPGRPPDDRRGRAREAHPAGDPGAFAPGPGRSERPAGPGRAPRGRRGTIRGPFDRIRGEAAVKVAPGRGRTGDSAVHPWGAPMLRAIPLILFLTLVPLVAPQAADAASPVEYDLPGDAAYQAKLYPPPELIAPELGLDTPEKVIAHFTRSSLDMDGIALVEGSLQVTDIDGSGRYRIRFEPLPVSAEPAARFAAVHSRLLDGSHAGQAINGAEACRETPGCWNPMEGYPVNRSDGPARWHLFLPLGMPIVNHKAVTLLHYPPFVALRTPTTCTT
jgi:hypothetical protein